MKKLVPITVTILSLISVALSVYGLVLALLTRFTELVSPFAIVAIVMGFVLSILCCTTAFSLKKSKLCLISGIVTAVSAIISAVAFIILF